jgi:hypothetical protein
MFGRVSIRHVAFAGGKSEETLPSKESCSKAGGRASNESAERRACDSPLRLLETGS